MKMTHIKRPQDCTRLLSWLAGMLQNGSKQRFHFPRKKSRQFPTCFALGFLCMLTAFKGPWKTKYNCPLKIIPSARPLRIFVADIPDTFNLELLHDSTREGCQRTDYALDMLSTPIGKFLNRSHPGDGAKSAYHGLEIYLHYQIIHSPLRVYNIEESDIVYVPLYPALAVYDNGPSGLGPCTAPVGKARSVLDVFFQQIDILMPYFGRKPHWMPLATLELEHMDGCGGWGSEMLCKYNNITAQFIFTVPEIAAIGVAYPAISMFRSATPQHENVVAVPYFGHFHMPQVTTPLDEVTTRLSKSMLAALVIGDRGEHHGAPLRPKLRQDCSARQHMCRAGFNVEEKNNNENVATVFELYKQSWFCVNPYGDTPTRLAFFDCATMGTTIPVVFDEHFASLAAFSEVVDYSKWLVSLNMTAALLKNTNVFEMLDQQIDVEERVQRLHALQQVAHLFQYSMIPSHNLVTFQEMQVVHQKDDAFTAGVKAIMRNLCRRNHLPQDACELGRGIPP